MKQGDIDFLLIDLNEKPEKMFRLGFNKILNLKVFQGHRFIIFTELFFIIFTTYNI